MADSAEDGLARWVRDLAAVHDRRIEPRTPVVPLAAGGLPTRPLGFGNAQVYRCRDVVVKLHDERTDPNRLTQRLRAIGDSGCGDLWLQPLRDEAVSAPSGRLATVWPVVTVLRATNAPPWAAIGRLLAGLHRLPVNDDLPRLGAHARLARAITWLRLSGPPEMVWLADLGEHLAHELAVPARITLAHGDFHLGQLGRVAGQTWRLLDVDDFGVGDPAWDLSRPAGFWAAGLLDDTPWQTFIDAYRRAGGPAVPADGDPWPALDVPARAAVLVAATRTVRTSRSGDTADALLAACRRMQA